MSKKVLCGVLALAISAVASTGCGDGSSASRAARPPEKPDPMKLDLKRIAADEARGIKFSKDKRTLLKYGRKLPDRSYAIPGGVTSVGAEAFAGCDALTEVTFPASLKSIGVCAFSNCGNLKSAALPAGVGSVGVGAFSFCMKLEQLTLPEGLETIGNMAFEGCDKLKRVKIPASVKSIGDGAFGYCPCESSVKKQFPKYRK